MMSVASTCSTIIHKDLVHHSERPVFFGERVLTNDVCSSKKCNPSSDVSHVGRKWLTVHHHAKSRLSSDPNDGFLYLNKSRSSLEYKKYDNRRRYMVCGVGKNVKISPQDNSQGEEIETRRQLKTLDSYFDKLHEVATNQQAPNTTGNVIANFRDHSQEIEASNSNVIENCQDSPLKTNSGLGSLDSYFDKLTADCGTQNSNSEISREETLDASSGLENFTSDGEYKEDDQMKEKYIDNLVSMSDVDDEITKSVYVDKYHEEQPVDEGSDFYLINLLVAVNIGVFLFAIASPVASSSIQQLSLPIIYGAKVNKLILDGEWWRLVTPMFLHSGFLQVIFSCWALLSFGPQVCKGYGPLTFLFIYILGGVCANVTSFVHTPELTVCGTGPVFAVIGAWLIYQIQNKEVIPPEDSENMFWKAVIATVMSFLLSNDGQIDEWIHLGAILSGVTYGYLTCPTVKLDSISAEGGQKEGISLVNRKANPWKSVLTFIISIATLSSLVYMIQPEVDFLELGNYL